MVPEKRGYFWMFVVVSFLLFASFVAADQGCFIYPNGECQSNVQREDAQRECVGDCDLDHHFFPGLDCDAEDVQTEEFLISQCEPITCSVNCNLMSLSECEELGRTTAEQRGVAGAAELVGQAVPLGQELFWCGQPRCCAVGNACSLQQNHWGCLAYGAQRNVAQPTERLDIRDANQCTAFCGEVRQPGTLQGRVTENGNNLQGVTIHVEPGNIPNAATDANGYSISLPTASYMVTVSKLGYV